MFLFYILLSVLPESVDLRVVDKRVIPGPPPPLEVVLPDTMVNDDILKLDDVVDLKAEIGTIPMLKKVEIPYEEILERDMAYRRALEIKKELKSALKNGISDAEIMKLKLEKERNFLDEAREWARIKGNVKEEGKISMQIKRIEDLLKEVEVEK